MIQNTKYSRGRKNGFTLVELLAVIVILAIIFVIAVPKVMSVIEDAKKATLESTAKMIASQAEKQKIQNTVLGNEEAITCEDITNINDVDYASCDIEFEDNAAKVTIEGSGKFEGLYVCDGTKTNAIAQEESCTVSIVTAAIFLEDLLAKESELNNGLVQTTAEYNGITYDAGIRYVGATDEVNNQVYYNCDDTDANGVSYGGENYDYASSCEVWRIIGVFDTKTSPSGTPVKRVKLININSTFTASWDSCASNANDGYGINQWGESTYEDGSTYEGADLMQLLNGYYIGEEEKCTYCNNYNQSTCSQTCTTESLKSANMKVLTTTAKEMIENAVWDTYATDSSGTASTAYIYEKGISSQYTGSYTCQEQKAYLCNDEVERTGQWIGLVGLMSKSDTMYSENNQGGTYLDVVSGQSSEWNINASHDTFYGKTFVSSSDGAGAGAAGMTPIGYRGFYVLPSVYLKSNIKIISGNGDTEPYKLAM